MRRRSIGLIMIMAVAASGARAADPQTERGRYLVQLGGCGDCHTPGHFFGHDDPALYLAGSDVGFATPLGVFVGPNLTPDDATGLGKWTVPQIIEALTTGTRPDGRILAPVMPWRKLAALTPADAQAMAAYLKSLKPISRKVGGPFGPGETPSVFVQATLPPDIYASLPKPK